MKKTKIGIIGLGGIAQVIHLPILNKIKDVEIVAICDKELPKARTLAQKHGVKSFYKDPEEMLKMEDSIEAVLIATNTDAHKDIAIKALNAGKDVLVERPIARNYDEAKAVVDSAKRKKRKLMVGMNSRFRNDVIFAKNFIKEKELGEIYHIRAGWLKAKSSDKKWFTEKEKSGGGVLLDNGIAMLDMGLWMLDFPEIKSVSAVNYYHNSKSVEDTNLSMIRFKNGSTLSIEVSWSMLTNDFFYCDAFGTSGSSKINPLKIYKKMSGSLLDITPKNVKMPSNLFKSSYELELNSFIAAVQGKGKLFSTGEDALKVMDIIEKIYESAKKQKEIICK